MFLRRLLYRVTKSILRKPTLRVAQYALSGFIVSFK